MKREDIYIIAEHSNWSEEGINSALQEHVYNDSDRWKNFLRLFTIGLGAAFLTLGVVFFFAYNWAGLHKFIKLGAIEALIISMILIAVYSKYSEFIKNIILSVATMMVGVLFAVFGQIYQTGANAFDFFLGWTMAVTLWVFIANFPVLWLIFSVLINITATMFLIHSHPDFSPQPIIIFFLLLNTLPLVLMTISSKIFKDFNYPTWLSNTQGLAIATISTVSLYGHIMHDLSIPWVLALTTIIYAAGIFYGLKIKRTFYIALIAISIIMLLGGLIMKISDNISGFLILGLFIVGSITATIKLILFLNKKWHHEKQ